MTGIIKLILRSCKNHRYLMCIAATLFSLSAITAETTQKEKPSEISKQKFISIFLPHFSKTVCDDTGIFRKCFSINKSQCGSSVELIGTECSKEVGGHMPKSLKSAHDSQKWGGKLALCIRQKFTEKHRSKLEKDNSSCKSLSSKK